MRITLSPTRMDVALTLLRDENVLTINDVMVDLTKYNEGESSWIIGQPAREKGIWQVTLVLPHGADAPHQVLFPKPVFVTQNGPILLPIA